MKHPDDTRFPRVALEAEPTGTRCGFQAEQRQRALFYQMASTKHPAHRKPGASPSGAAEAVLGGQVPGGAWMPWYSGHSSGREHWGSGPQPGQWWEPLGYLERPILDCSRRAGDSGALPVVNQNRLRWREPGRPSSPGPGVAWQPETGPSESVYAIEVERPDRSLG